MSPGKRTVQVFIQLLPRIVSHRSNERLLKDDKFRHNGVLVLLLEPLCYSSEQEEHSSASMTGLLTDVLTLTHGSLHIPHDEAVLVVQKLHPDLCDLQDNKKIKDTKMPTTVVLK